MHLYIQIGELQLPSYSLMIVLGLLTGNFLVWILGKRYKMMFEDFLILEAYTCLGALGGSKGLYLFVMRDHLHWDRFFEPEYFSSLMLGGFVFYGGLIGGVLCFFLAGKIHRIDTGAFIRRFMFVVPLIHGFGRIGCFMAGCCYGRPYNGPGAVIFPENSMAPAGISLFPVQLAEAVCLFALAGILYLASLKIKSPLAVMALYFALYAVLRFVLEYFRYDDAERGGFWLFSTSQWISIGIVAALALTVPLLVRREKRSVRL